mgnify:CR=1 FL=1
MSRRELQHTSSSHQPRWPFVHVKGYGWGTGTTVNVIGRWIRFIGIALCHWPRLHTPPGVDILVACSPEVCALLPPSSKKPSVSRSHSCIVLAVLWLKPSFVPDFSTSCLSLFWGPIFVSVVMVSSCKLGRHSTEAACTGSLTWSALSKCSGTVDCCAPLCTVLLMRLHCAADKGARRPLDEKVAKNFYKSPHLRNTSKQPTMKKIYKRYITMSRISHINSVSYTHLTLPTKA